MSVLVGLWDKTEVTSTPNSNYAHVKVATNNETSDDLTFVIWDTDKARELAAALVFKADEKDARDASMVSLSPNAPADAPADMPVERGE